MTKFQAIDTDCLTIALEDGEAHNMGEGSFVVLQKDETTGRTNNVVLCEQDLEALKAPPACLTLALCNGVAEYVGEGLWGVYQRDHDMKPQGQLVILSDVDAGAMLAAAQAHEGRASCVSTVTP